MKHKAWTRMKIRCIETGKIWDSAADVCRELKASESAMSNHLSGKFPSLRGFTFERISNEQ